MTLNYPQRAIVGRVDAGLLSFTLDLTSAVGTENVHVDIAPL